MPFLQRCVAAANLALVFVLCAAAPSRLTLSDKLPDDLADALLARVLAKAVDIGLPDVEGLGKPYALLHNRTPLGAILVGRSTNVGPDSRVTTCFVALVEPGDQSTSVLPIPERGRQGEASCQGYIALGLLPSDLGIVRLGILFDMDEQPHTIPVILAWHDRQPPAIDSAGTAACRSRHVTTIAAMRRPGCGKPSALDRAFSSP